MTGFLTRGPTPFTDDYVLGDGAVRIEVTDQVQSLTATEGDSGQLSARFSVNGDSYTVELTRPGFPARAGVAGAPIGGGVLLDVDVNGSTGLGYPSTTRAHAAIALWGSGTVRKNGAVLTTHAMISAMALSQGTHADDDTHRLLPQARAQDEEIEVLVTQLPRAEEPTGFLQFGFDDVEITLDGVELPSVASVATVPEILPEQAGRGQAYGTGGSGYPAPGTALYSGAGAISAPQFSGQEGAGKPPAPPELPGRPAPETGPLNVRPPEPALPGQQPVNSLTAAAPAQGPALPGQPPVSNAPLNSAPAQPLPQGIAPLSSAPSSAPR